MTIILWRALPTIIIDKKDVKIKYGNPPVTLASITGLQSWKEKTLKTFELMLAHKTWFKFERKRLQEYSCLDGGMGHYVLVKHHYLFSSESKF